MSSFPSIYTVAACFYNVLDNPVNYWKDHASVRTDDYFGLAIQYKLLTAAGSTRRMASLTILN